jgi:hypothetical protein
MYIDKLDGRIDAAFSDRNAAQWRAEQDRLPQLVRVHLSRQLAEGSTPDQPPRSEHVDETGRLVIAVRGEG